MFNLSGKAAAPRETSVATKAPFVGNGATAQKLPAYSAPFKEI